MPFNAGGQTYQGGTLLAQGIGGLGQSIGQGIFGQLEEHRKKEALTDQIMLQALQQGYATPEDWLKYSQSNGKGKQDFAMRIASNFHDDARKRMELQNQQLEAQNRLATAHANYFTSAAADALSGGMGGAPKGKIWSDELGGWATPAQADAARRRTTQGFIQQSYGLTPEQIFDSSQHEGGTVTIDPTTGAKKFTNDPKGDQIRIGGEKGVIMSVPEHEIYKRQLQMQGFQAGGGPPMGAAQVGGLEGVTGGGGVPAGPSTTVGGITTTRMVAPATGGTVRVRSPEGVTGTIPANRLQEAIQAGYTQL